MRRVASAMMALGVLLAAAAMAKTVDAVWLDVVVLSAGILWWGWKASLWAM